MIRCKKPSGGSGFCKPDIDGENHIPDNSEQQSLKIRKVTGKVNDLLSEMLFLSTQRTFSQLNRLNVGRIPISFQCPEIPNFTLRVPDFPEMRIMRVPFIVFFGNEIHLPLMSPVAVAIRFPAAVKSSARS